MSCITQLLELKGDKEFLPIGRGVVIEGGSTHKDHEYLITFTIQGTRCGYVALKKDLSDSIIEELQCHGGITFNETHHPAKDLLDIPCNDKWIGFDANHGWDGACGETAQKYFSTKAIESFATINFYRIMSKMGPHRTYEYMEEECKSLIDQVYELRA